jgi:hypothetical protein
MAGLGKKTFVAGEVLLAQDVNGYLMDQSVMVFGGTAARSSAIPTPTEGMMSYRTDDNVVEVFDGSAYVGVGGASGALTLVTAQSFTTATSFSLPTNTFSADYTNYKLQVFITGTSAQSTVTMRYRTAGTDNSAATYNQASAGRDSDGNAINITQSSATSFTVGQNFATGGFIINLDIFNPVGATRTLANGFYSIDGQASGGNISSSPTSLLFRNTTSFDSMSIISSVASSLTGSYKVYGYANS